MMDCVIIVFLVLVKTLKYILFFSTEIVINSSVFKFCLESVTVSCLGVHFRMISVCPEIVEGSPVLTRILLDMKCDCITDSIVVQNFRIHVDIGKSNSVLVRRFSYSKNLFKRYSLSPLSESILRS